MAAYVDCGSVNLMGIDHPMGDPMGGPTSGSTMYVLISMLSGVRLAPNWPGGDLPHDVFPRSV
jgi:hypothetical protein